MLDDRVVASSTGDPRLISSTPQATPNNNNLLMNLPPPPGRDRDPLATYVVRVPKDQIYRIPPPENAGIIERHREAAKVKKTETKRNCCTYFIWIVIVLLAIGVIIGGTFLAIYFIYTPKSPNFTVLRLHVTQQKRGRAPTYHVTLKVKNTNENMGIEYIKDGDSSASLSFSNKNLGFGDFPSLQFEQKAGDSSNVNIKIHGLKNKPLPANVKKSITDKKTKHQVSLKLKFESPLVFNVWIFKPWKKNLDVTCDLKVSTMAEGSKIMSQKCKTKMS